MNTINNTAKKFEFQLDEFYLDLQDDGRNISVLKADEIARMPFPGLRPFKTSEFQLFQGRSGQAVELINRLKKTHFLAVIGSSGTGKSSLVRAGLIPELFGGSLNEAGSRWNIAICRPGKDPIGNLAVALSYIKGQSKNEDVLLDHFKIIEPRLSRSICGLLDVNESLNEGKSPETQSNLLVIVDQFEELFRYDRKDLGKENIENHFVDLLLEATSSLETSIYVIITMRSEFLGDCVKYRELPEAVNAGQYLVPGLGRSELKEVIEVPISLAGKEIESGLVELLINEIDKSKLKENLDQLPILQHALMRTYHEALKRNSDVVRYEHYQKIGEMERALGNHAKEKFDELKDPSLPSDRLSKKQKIARLVFQALTDASTDLKGGRRPTELKNLYAICRAINADKYEVNEVIDKFRDTDTSFIMPPINTPLHDKLIIDISHESLMRNWDDLKIWVQKETQNGRRYQRLNERREDDQVMTGALLADLNRWASRYPHSAAWASRYHNLANTLSDDPIHEELYNKNLAFLNQSEKASIAAAEAENEKIAADARRQKEEELRIEKERGGKRMQRVLIGAVLVAIALTSWAFISRDKAKTNEVLAKQKEQVAYRQMHISDSLQKASDRLNKALKESRDSATAQRDTAINLADKFKNQTLDLAKAKKKADKYLGIAQKQKVELEKQLVQIDLQRELFYSSKLIDNETKNDVLQSLLPLADSKKIPPENYIDVKELDDINSAVKIWEDMSFDPVWALRQARELWMEKKNENVYFNKILLKIFNKNNFPKQKIDPLLYQSSLPISPPSILIANDNSRFAMANRNQVVTGYYNGDALTINDVISTAPPTSDSLDIDPFKFKEFKYKKINAFFFKDSAIMLVLKNDSMVILQKGKEQELLGLLSNSDHLRLSAFSPNGKYLVTISNDNVLKRWNIIKMQGGQKVDPDTISLDSRNKNLRQLIFSPDGQRLVTSFTDNRVEVWNFLEKRRSPKFPMISNGQAANFAADSNFLIIAAADKYIDVYDTSRQLINSIKLFASSEDENYTTAPVQQVALSRDWKTLLINYGSSILLFMNLNDDSIFKRGTRVDSRNLKSVKLFSYEEEILNAEFLNQNNVISLSEEGSLYLWNTNKIYKNLKEAFRSIELIIDSNYVEKEEAGSVSFEKLLTDLNQEQLREAGTHYYTVAMTNNDETKAVKEMQINKAKRLFSNLAKGDDGFFIKIDSAKLTALDKFLLEYDSLNVIDTSSIFKVEDKVTRIEKLWQDVKKGESQLQSNLGDSTLVSSQYWTLSWLLLFTGKYDSALYAGNRGLELCSRNDGIYTNLALAHLLKGDFAVAEEIYKKYKDKNYSSIGARAFKDAFLKDFDDLEREGIITPFKPDVYKKMQYIKRNILGIK